MQTNIIKRRKKHSKYSPSQTYIFNIPLKCINHESNSYLHAIHYAMLLLHFVAKVLIKWNIFPLLKIWLFETSLEYQWLLSKVRKQNESKDNQITIYNSNYTQTTLTQRLVFHAEFPEISRNFEKFLTKEKNNA